MGIIACGNVRVRTWRIRSGLSAKCINRNLIPILLSSVLLSEVLFDSSESDVSVLKSVYWKYKNRNETKGESEFNANKFNSARKRYHFICVKSVLLLVKGEMCIVDEGGEACCTYKMDCCCKGKVFLSGNCRIQYTQDLQDYSILMIIYEKSVSELYCIINYCNI